jgi:hypothetical protein
MRPPLEYLMPPQMGAELIYSFVIIVCSLMVYYGTKELYELSSYKGIKYFRFAFLFFAIAYFFRYTIRFILSLFNIQTMHEFMPMYLVGPLTLFLFIYFSSMAVFYLLYSVMWKRWNGNSKMIYLFHAVAVVISFLSIISRSNEILLGINLLLLVIVFFIYFIAHKDAHKDSKTRKHNLYVVYMLLFVFWTLNIIDIMIPKFLQEFQLIIYLASSFIFLTILYKVLKRAGS